MTTKLSVGLVINGETEVILPFTRELENIIAAKGLRLIFVKQSNHRLFVIEDDFAQNGGGQE